MFGKLNKLSLWEQASQEPKMDSQNMLRLPLLLSREKFEDTKG